MCAVRAMVALVHAAGGDLGSLRPGRGAYLGREDEGSEGEREAPACWKASDFACAPYQDVKKNTHES